MATKTNKLENDPLLASFYKMDFGTAQFYVYFLAWLGAFVSAPVYVDSNFLIRRTKHRCFVPGCDDPNEPDFSAEFANYTIPDGDECSMYQRSEPVTNSSTCELDDFNLNVKTNCSEKVFDTSLFTSTTVTEFDLTCENAWLGPLAGSMYMVGMLLGAITIGDLADRFGRKVGILVSVMLLGGGGVLSAVSPNYYMFLAMRLLTGAGGVGLFQVTFVLAVEFIGAKYRTFCGIMIEVPFALGEAMTGVLAIFIRDWRWLQVAVTAPAFLLLSYMWIMPESVRWLVSQGKRDVAVKIIKKAADVNGVEVPKHLLEDSNTEVPTVDGSLSVASSKAELVKEDPGEPEPKVTKSVIDLLRTPNMRKRSFNLFYCWAVCTLVYYGLSSNSGNLGGNIFINFIATMLIEIPSYVFSFLVLDRMGRKGTLSFVLLLGGVACFVSGFIPEDFGAVIVTLSLVGKFGIAAAFAIVYVYSAEIFPTEYRSVGIGACSMCARIGGIIAPFVASLAHTYKPLPLLVFGSLSIVAGLLVVLLPETVGCELPQTIPESERFGSDQSIWYFSCCGKKRSEPVTEENTATEDQRV
ncbi:organic cation transporter protein-like isoform X2 [Penaeus chinensis]|uniref:organic cation transporter protein-like isoform X2 n=1 Tax=Penaeus chinensis TaxID=139456 RepID=UPI001FB5E067|nr:organic cation transporter protein-like isoform X2 [Penaeus chinensis]XP_047493503.1 organic cation transporter protein-like isoform X2 [Penaeus chinensis]XP_047493511.1 organic cation transporter protein-like isoform X2 [Penaeus chinensis]